MQTQYMEINYYIFVQTSLILYDENINTVNVL